MAARNRYHEVRNPAGAQSTAAFPIEGWVDPATGQRLRRECLGQVYGGHLILGNIPRSTGIDLYYRRSMGNPASRRLARSTPVCAGLLSTVGPGICAGWGGPR